MAITVSNTNLNDSFNTWRLNGNEVATILANNIVTVARAGSADRKSVTVGNGHIKGTFTANELRTTTLKSGNTSDNGGWLNINSNTTINATSLAISSNTTFSGNVVFNTAGTDRLVLGNLSRIRLTGGSGGQVIKQTGTDTIDFVNLTLRDMQDMSSNSAHLILSGANTSFAEAAGQSPHLKFANANDAIEFYMSGGAGGTGTSDLYLELADTGGNSRLNIVDSSNTVVAYIDSDGNADFSGTFTADGATTLNGDVTLGDADTDTITVKGKFANQATTGTASFNGTTHFNGTTNMNGTLNLNGNVNVGDAAGDTITINSTSSFAGNTTIGDSTADTLTVNSRVMSDLVANGTYDLGTSSLRWTEVWGQNLDLSGTINAAGKTTVAALHANGNIDTDGTLQVDGATTLGSTLGVTGTTSLNGAVNLGDAVGDTITVKGRIANQHTTGTATFGGKVGVGATPSTGFDLETGNSAKVGENLTVSGNTSIGGNLDVSGSITFPADSAFEVANAIFGSLVVNGNTTLGDSGDDIHIVTGTYNSSLVPKTASRQSLGSGSSAWHNVYANNVTVNDEMTVTNRVSITKNLQVSGNTNIDGNITADGTWKNDSTVIVGSNGKLHANNTISNDTIRNAMILNDHVALGANTGTDTDIALGETVDIVSGTATGITTAVSANTITISGVDATTSIKGVAKFNSNNFVAASGLVTLKDKGVASAKIANTMTSGTTKGSATKVPVITVNDRGQVIGIKEVNGSGVSTFTYTTANNVLTVGTASSTIKVPITAATTTSGTGRGVASFDSGDFSLSSGHVTLADSATGAVTAISGTSNEVNVSRSNGTVTVGLPDDVTVTGQLNVGENVVVTGNLIVQGTTTTVNSETVNIADNKIVLNSDYTGSTPTADAGFVVERGTKANYEFIWDESEKRFSTAGRNLAANNFVGNVIGNVTGNITGNLDGTAELANTAVKLQTGRTVAITGDMSYTSSAFDGTGNVTGTGTLSTAAGSTLANYMTVANTQTLVGDRLGATASVSLTGDITGSASFSGNSVSISTTYNNDVVLGTDTSGNYVATVTAGTGVSVGTGTGEGSTPTIAIGQAVATSSDVQFDSFGVGTAASGTTGEIRATNNVTAYYSDARLKNFLGNIDNALDKVNALNGYFFEENEKAKELGYDNDDIQVGVSAQEVEAVLPHVVTEAPIDPEYLTVYYDKLVPLLIEAIKELSAKVDKLENK